MNRKTLLAAASAMASELATAQSYGSGMMWGDGWGTHGFMPLLWWGLVVVVVVLAFRWNRWHHNHGSGSQDRALSILRERYARGEIDKTEFEARKRDLVD